MKIQSKQTPQQKKVVESKKNKKNEPAYNSKLITTLALIIAAVGFVLYSQTLSYDFTLDDYSAIKENRVTKQGISAIGTIFKTTYRYGYTIQGDELYRPIPKSIFAILWSVSPDNPFYGHLLNVIFYALTGMMLFIVLSKYIRNNLYVPFIAALLFMVHPIHTEVAASIKSMDEVLGLLLFFCAMYFVYEHLSSNKIMPLIIAGVCYMASLMSKESSITFVAIVPLMIYFFTSFSNAQNLKVSLTMLGVALVFLMIRQGIVGQSNAGAVAVADNLLMQAKDVASQKATAIFIMGLYLKLLFFPHPLVFDCSVNQFPIVSPGDWKFLLSFAIYIALAVYAVMQFRKKDLIAFGIIFFFITASLSSNVFMIIGTHYGERLMYSASFGFCFAIAALLSKFINQQNENETKIETVGDFFKMRPAVLGIVAVISILFSAKTFAQNPVWQSNLSLYEHGVIASPNSTRTHYYLGNYITKEDYYNKLPKEKSQSEIKRGIDELKRSTQIYPFSESYLSLGVIYYRQKNFDSSMYFYNKAIEAAPYIATIHNNIGTLYFESGHYDKALTAFKKAVELDPNYAEAYCNLGSAYGTLNQLDYAINNFKKAIELDPNNAMANYFMGITLKNKGDAMSAQPYLDKAAALEPKTYKK